MIFLSRTLLVLCVVSILPAIVPNSPASAQAAARRPEAGSQHARLPLHQRIVLREGGPAGRALVLEPFAGELNLGANAGEPEIDALAKAGFLVDVFRDSAVTIPVIESMARYSVVYMESHSGTCGPPLCAANDAFVLTGVKVPNDTSVYRDLFVDGSMTEGSPDTSPGLIYLAFTSRLISRHGGRFTASSIVFINGCDLLATPSFIEAFSAGGASTIYSWNKRVYNADAESAADFIFGRLRDGATVSSALQDARAVGLGSSQAEEGASLALFGDPDNTLLNALHQATPTPAPTPTGTPIPQATPLPRPTAAIPGPQAGCTKGFRRVHGRCRPVKKRGPMHPSRKLYSRPGTID